MCEQRREQIFEKRYTINDIVRTFGISRTTVMYYEQLGIVEPAREGEQARRAYSDVDVFRLMSAMLLKNVGIPPKELPAHLEDEPFSAEHFDEYERRIERDLAYKQALLERMRMYRSVAANVGAATVREVGEFYFVPDNAETGYRHFPQDYALDVLIAHMPIASLGSWWDGVPREGRGDSWGTNHWGRTVPVRYAGLIDGFCAEGLAVLGGCTCVCFIMEVENLRTDGIYDVQFRATCLAQVANLGYEPAGNPFCPFCLPSAERFIFPTCVPVRLG